MKVIIQRVKEAKCIVDNNITGEISSGLMLLVSFCIKDEFISYDILYKMAKKISNMRIFSDDEGKMNKSIKDINGSILSISQFTLYANPYEGNRPSFVDALKGDIAKPLYLKFNEILRNEFKIKVEEGIFGADMKLDIICDGPVTIEVEY